MMTEGQQIAAEVGAVAVGVVQPFLLRQYVDTRFGTLIPQIGAYGTPSALAGFGLGGGALGLGLAGLMMNKGPVRDPQVAKILISYGAAALTTSTVVAYLTPTVQAAAASGATSAQGVFRPQQKVVQAPARAVSAAAANYNSLNQQERLMKGVY